ncbi:MAG: helix-turn-helix domain-containing protein [Xanthobacteraceae bacterium]|jgi:predicted DNA-binding transcriptional regulator AlpA
MTSQYSLAGGVTLQKPAAPALVLLTPKEAARLLKVSVSWLAKARMRGDGPLFMRIGRSIRYAEPALLQWMKSRQRLSTSEQ